MSKRLLYFSCHETLEYDELKLFSELGWDCFSLGAYTQPGGEEHRKRPPLELPYSPHFIELSLQYDRRKIHPEMLEDVDVVVIMHEPSFLGFSSPHEELGEGNWPIFRDFIKNGGRVIWRSIGQSIPFVERKLSKWREEGLEIVRYSPAEQTIADYCGADAVIRFYKDPEEYKGWTGSRKMAINFTQSLKERADFTGYRTISRVLEQVPGQVYGPNNEDLGVLSGGLLTYEQQRQVMQEARAFIYHGTYPASYTLSFIEAMMTGTPIVAVGPRLGNGPMFNQQKTYEIPTILQHETSGFVSDDPAMLLQYVEELLNDPVKARYISLNGRNRAIELFGEETIKKQWQEFLG